MNTNVIQSVNYHLTSDCNMRCKYCFSANRRSLNQSERIEVVRKIGAYYRDQGIKGAKITFVGGEPLLCEELPILLQTAKEYGLTTMIVSNGSLLTDEFLKSCQGVLDWIGLSIDSLSASTNKSIGRCTKDLTPNKDTYLSIIEKVHRYNYRLKINTVVSLFNWQEDFNDFISKVCPERWKIFQVLPIQDVNTHKREQFEINSKIFSRFLERHQNLPYVAESNDDMRESYFMISPDGRVFDNAHGNSYSKQNLLEIDINTALEQITVHRRKFVERGGEYTWGLDS